MYVYELDLFVTVQIFEDAPAVLSLGKQCEDHGDSHEWTSGQKTHLIENDRKIQCNTVNRVPIFVPGLSTSFSSSITSTSPASFPQDSTEDSKSSPATIRRRRSRRRTPGDQLRGSEHSEDGNKDVDPVQGNPCHNVGKTGDFVQDCWTPKREREKTKKKMRQ